MKHPKRHLAMLIKCWNSIIGPDSFPFLTLQPEPERIDRCYRSASTSSRPKCRRTLWLTSRPDVPERSGGSEIASDGPSPTRLAVRTKTRPAASVSRGAAAERDRCGLVPGIGRRNDAGQHRSSCLRFPCALRRRDMSHLNGVFATLMAIARYHLKWSRDELDWPGTGSKTTPPV